MTTMYTVNGWVIRQTLQSPTTHWNGHGTLDDPWVITPADDIWGWFVREPRVHRCPHAVALTLEYNLRDGRVQTTITATAEPVLQASVACHR